MVINCTGIMAGSNTEDPIKERSRHANICHSSKLQSRDSAYGDLKASAYLVWMGNRQWGAFIKQ